MSAPQNLENQVALVPCPKCGARANVGCFVPSGKLRANHAARRQLWRKKVELSKSPDDALIFAITQVTEINTRLTAELSTLKEQLRVTNEMLAAARFCSLRFDGGYLIETNGTPNPDPRKFYSMRMGDISTVVYHDSILAAFAAIREQQEIEKCR